MAANLRFIVHPAHRNTLKFAPQRPRNRPPQRRFAHPGRPHEAENRALELRFQLHHGQKIKNSVLDLLQIIVVLVQNGSGMLHIDRFAGGNTPRQGGHPFQPRPRHRMFRRHGVDTRETAQFLQRFLLNLLRHPGLLNPFTEFGRFLLAILPFPQLRPDGFQLLPQIEFALALGQLPLHLRLDLLAQFQQFHLARQLLINEFQARAGYALFEHGLPLRMAQIRQVARDEIRQTAHFRDASGGSSHFVRNVRAGGNDLGELAQHVLAQGGQFRRNVRFNFRQPLDARAQEGFAGRVLFDPHPRHAFTEEQLALPQAHDLVDHRHRAGLIKFFRTRLIRPRVNLRDHPDQPVFAE